MKKLFFIAVGLFLSLNFANANDLLFKASNGALNQNSVGVKKLTDEEMAQVKGGLLNPTLYKQYSYVNSQGHTISSTFWTINLDSNERRTSSLNLDNGVSGYHNYSDFITLSRLGTVVVQIDYNKNTGTTQSHIAAISDRTYYVADKFARALKARAVNEFNLETRAKRY